MLFDDATAFTGYGGKGKICMRACTSTGLICINNYLVNTLDVVIDVQ
jgi:hypothetical protein